jgi:Winged helix DNA-binding domain
VRVLTQRELNRALLARQMLLERVRAPLPRVIERMGGIQAQYAPSAYIGLWSRVAGFERADLTRALERRTLIQATLLRSTIHIVSRRDYWPWKVAIREAQREWLARAWPEIAARDTRTVDRKLRAALRDGPRRRDELIALVGKEGWEAATIELVRAPPSGTWENRRAHLFALAEDWVGPSDADAGAARELLVRRYLAAFGPAAHRDIERWAGLRTKDVEQALARIEPRRFRDERGKELLDLPRAPLPDPETPAPPRFVGTFDAMLLVHARRTGVVPEEYRPRIFHTKAPQSFHTFLLDGAVAGTWRHENGRIALEPFRKLTREERRELADEAERLAAFHA